MQKKIIQNYLPKISKVGTEHCYKSAGMSQGNRHGTLSSTNSLPEENPNWYGQSIRKQHQCQRKLKGGKKFASWHP